MAEKSKIEWTESTWNPVTGCTKISEGCLNCYAERMARRLKSMRQEKYRNCFNVTMHEKCLNEPLSWKKPQIIFVCSMSDLFHKDVTDEFIIQVFEIMNKAFWHKFQVLTKRADRLAEISPKLNWTKNIWVGVTVENDKYKNRIEYLMNIPASVKYLSIEPLLGKVTNIPLDNIDWVIVGGESGPNSRPMSEDWVLPIRDKCIETNTPFFFKQWGGTNKKLTGCELQGEEYKQMPILK